MALNEVYRLAHTAECRLHISVSRPDRHLRFVVGHLMHYESLRLRIVEIEHDIGRNERALRAGDVHANRLSHKPSTGQLGRRSPPPSHDEIEYDDEDDIDADDDDDAELGLTRFPSATSKPPALVRDTTEEDEDEEPPSPEEPDADTLNQALKQPSDDDMAHNLERVRRCTCHSHTDAPSIQHLWVLPAKEGDTPGVVRAVAQVES